jgi:hypothetical protein
MIRGNNEARKICATHTHTSDRATLSYKRLNKTLICPSFIPESQLEQDMKASWNRDEYQS